MQEALDDLERNDILSREQAALLRQIYARELFSVHWELRILLYGGILVLTAGLGLLVAKHFASIGDLTLLAAIALGCTACFAYCLRHGGGFSPERLATPDAAYDYVLLLGCLLLGTLQSYLELRYQLLAQSWNWWLLVSALTYLLCAHYFDNRLVLSLALSTLGAWLGVKTSLPGAWPWDGALRDNAIFFGGLVVAAGAMQTRLGWKRHFLPVHLHLGINVLLAALVAGVGSRGADLAYLAGLLLAGSGSAFYALRERSFAFLLYAVLYGYLGITIFVFNRGHWSSEGVIFYFLASAASLLMALVALHRRFRSAE
ncbi:DUF2157 domain-containing protein [Geomonas anaerohicana]|uniref:DUF2157 domain-containing protein n=1 Tax=Geomonas anaerohicana TaxID=2798583 RepID=A0ABS0YGP6_9BACT|nr:DUF2157 domain-containing protein [Geomonas anaerohicana]MBJ6751497.1 DUF2157 domain-containing protein [Geomonas anaerohicana]